MLTIKTIKELADEFGVSKQAVYARITREPLRGALEALPGGVSVSARGTMYISEEGADLVRSAYAEKYTPAALRPGDAAASLAPRPANNKQTNDNVDRLITRLDGLAALLDERLAMLESVHELHTVASNIETLQEQLKIKDTQIQELQGFLKESAHALLLAQKEISKRYTLEHTEVVYFESLRPMIDQLSKVDDLLFYANKKSRKDD